MNLLVLVVGTGLTIVILYLGVRMAATSSQQPTTSKQLVAAFLGGATVAIAVFGAQSLVSETRSERTRRPSSTERLLRRVREEIKRARTSQERMMVQLVLSLEADLSGIDLSNRNLARLDLTDRDLSDAELRGADLTEADLSGANLSGADLRDASLVGTDLRRALLSRADLRGADLERARVCGGSYRRTRWPQGFRRPPATCR